MRSYLAASKAHTAGAMPRVSHPLLVSAAKDSPRWGEAMTIKQLLNNLYQRWDASGDVTPDADRADILEELLTEAMAALRKCVEPEPLAEIEGPISDRAIERFEAGGHLVVDEGMKGIAGYPTRRVTITERKP